MTFPFLFLAFFTGFFAGLAGKPEPDLKALELTQSLDECRAQLGLCESTPRGCELPEDFD